MKLPSVLDCTHTNCRYHFPQFKGFDPSKWLKNLEESINDPFFKTSEEKKVLFRQSIELLKKETLDSVIKAILISGEAYGIECYLDLLGFPVVYQPCCK